MTAIENSQIKELTERMDDFAQHLSTLAMGQKEIKDAIIGTEFNEKQAYKARIENLEAFKAQVEIKMLKAQIWATFIGAGVIGLAQVLFKYAEIFIKK